MVVRRLQLQDFLSHAILVLLGEAAKLAVEVDVDLEVEVALVAEVGPHSKDAEDLFALLGGDVVLQVEDRLLPVRVGGLGRRRESNPLVTFSELDVEEGHQGLKLRIRKMMKRKLTRRALP